MEYWAPGSYTQGLSWLHASFSNELYFPNFFLPGHIYIYTAAQLDGEGAISVLFGLSALFLLHRGKGSGWLRIVEGP